MKKCITLLRAMANDWRPCRIQFVDGPPETRAELWGNKFLNIQASKKCTVLLPQVTRKRGTVTKNE